MPLPTLDTTPPVTKMYFVIPQVPLATKTKQQGKVAKPSPVWEYQSKMYIKKMNPPSKHIPSPTGL
jgi:hypothetical protein